MRKLNRDTLNNVPLTQAANAAMTVIDALQTRFTPEVQVMGIAAAFRLLADQSGLSPQDLMSATDNAMNHADGRRAEFKAVSQYVEEIL